MSHGLLDVHKYSTSNVTWTTRCTHTIVQVMSHGLLNVHKYSTINVTWTTRCTQIEYK